MEHWVKIAIMYGAGAFVLLTDLFIPSHGVLALGGLILIGFGVYEAFIIGTTTGVINVVVWMIVLPVGMWVAVRNWHRTPVGRRISPPNPKLTEQDRMPVSNLQALIGRTGRSMTLLRPVGTCEFDGHRVECMAEYGIIEMGVRVEAVGMSDRTVVVRPVASV
jgi:membrane-bound serine protease (ClpP class)